MSTFPLFRRFGRARGLSLAVVLMLAFGVAALGTTFAIVRAALWRQPPFRDAAELALLFIVRDDNGTPRRERWSFTRSELLRTTQRSFVDVARYSPASLTLAGNVDAETVNGERVSASYFSLLGVKTARGRLFGAAEDDPGQPAPVAVLGHGLWSRRFGSDTAILGQTIRLNGVLLTVVGIMPEGFRGLSGTADLWVPATLTPRLTYAEYLTTNQNFISVVGRVRPGVSMDEARGELAGLGRTINRAAPSDPERPEEAVTATAVTLNESRVDRTVRRSLLVLLGAVGLLHLLACANAINLLLGYAATRQRDTAVRIAIGGSARRLFSERFMEVGALAALGGVLGTALAWWTTSFVAPPTNVWAPRNFYGSLAAFDAPRFGGIELALALALAAATTVLVALPAALSALRVDVLSGIKAGSRSLAGGAMKLRRPTARGAIVGLESALAMLLVVAAALLIDSFRRMRGADLGVDSRQVLTFWVIPSEVTVPPNAAPSFVTRLLETVSRVPGVRSATVDGGAPVSGSATTGLFIAGRPTPAEPPGVRRHYVAPGHFETLGISLLRGRGFTDRDVAGAPRVTVISESAARQFWPNEDAIGRRVWFSSSGYNSPDSSAEIVGIVSDVVYAPLDQQPNRASFYTPFMQFTYAPRMVFLRTDREPLSLVPEVRKALQTVDPDLSMREPQTLDQIVSGSWARHRFDAFLFGGFGMSALALAASGIFAVLAYVVSTRVREFGIRIALGARPLTVISQVLAEGMAFPMLGVAVGTLAALGATRVLSATLYGITSRDPIAYVGTAALLVIVAVVACIVPAWRATRVDPMEALRSE
ncbi:MAG: ADOP family duplicated permease [Gemmatimonadaceae bacterium]